MSRMKDSARRRSYHDSSDKQNESKGSKSPSPKPDAKKDGLDKKKVTRMSSMGKLTQEIEEEFLTCKICLDSFRTPKTLNCLHSFCEQCIDAHVMSECTYKKYSDYREFTCPLCRKRTALPIGGVKKLPDNFLIMNLIETVGRQKPTKYPYCDFCKMVSKKHKEANSKCLDCNKLLCKECVDTHRETKVTRNHDIFDVEIEKDIECKEHPEEVVRFYCEECEACVCVLCTFNEHKDHEVTQFADAVVKYKDHIADLVGSCRKKIEAFDYQMEDLNKCEQTIKDAEKAIHDMAIKCISDIRAKEKSLCEELQNIYGSDAMDYINNKTDVSVQVDSLRSTCNLTEVILKGKDIELLLLKKDVEEKLNTLHEVDVKSLPKTISKEVKFVPGQVDLGYIQDMDRPLLSKMRAKRQAAGSFDQGDFPPHEEAAVQTEPPECEERAEGTGHGAEIAETHVQTEQEEEESESSEEEEVEKCDQFTETESVETEEKGVNTRSRALLGSRSSLEGDPDTAAAENGYRERRRRRRERAETFDATSGDWSPQQQYSPGPKTAEENQQQSFWERRRARQRYGWGGEPDEYYDANG